MFDKYTPNVKAAILGAAVTVSLAVFTGIFQLGRYVGEKDLEEVNTFKHTDIPKLLFNLGEIAKVIDEKITSKHKIEELEKELSHIKSKLLDAENEIKSKNIDIGKYTENLKNLQEEIAAMTGGEEKEFTLKQNETVFPIKNILRIGLIYTSSILSKCTMNINNTQQTFLTGESHDITIGSKICRVVLLKVNSDSVEIAVNCRSN